MNPVSDQTESSRRVMLDSLLDGFAESVPAVEVTGLCLDSRRIRSGNAYVAMQGDVSHGLDYIDSAVSEGASAILVDVDDPVWHDRKISGALPVVAVTRLRETLGSIASRYHQEPSKKMGVCGVTGTDGKTSVCRFISESLSRLGHCAGYIGTVGWGIDNEIEPNPLTTPDPITLQAMINSLYERGAEFVALEVSSHALVQGRVQGVSFDVAVLTNLGRDHLDYHGDIAAYREAKQRLFNWPDLGAVVLNADDEFGRSLFETIQGQHNQPGVVTRYSVSGSVSDVHAQGIVASDKGLAFTLADGDVIKPVASPLLGDFNVQNLLACYCVLKAFGICAGRASSVLEEISSVSGRMERFIAPSGQIQRANVVVDFAHTPQALGAALKTLRAHCAGKLWVVFGCGGDRDSGKRAPMAEIACQLADAVIVTDDNPRTESSAQIIEQILTGASSDCNVKVISDRLQAIKFALETALTDDWVLIAGKGHEDYQIVGDQRLAFSDREVVARLLQSADSGRTT